MVNVDLDTKDQVKETKGEGGTKRWLKLELSHDSTVDRIGMISIKFKLENFTKAF